MIMGISGIICSLDCYNITIEGNEVYNHGTLEMEEVLHLVLICMIHCKK